MPIRYTVQIIFLPSLCAFRIYIIESWRFTSVFQILADSYISIFTHYQTHCLALLLSPPDTVFAYLCLLLVVAISPPVNFV